MNEQCSCPCGSVMGKIATLLLVVGGLNWGLVGLSKVAAMETDLNLVTLALGKWPMVEGIVYLLVGAAALYMTVAALMGCKKSA